MGIKLNLEITESGFRKQSASLYELSILLRMDSLVYLIKDNFNRIQVLKHYELELSSNAKNYHSLVSEIFEKDTLLQAEYKGTKVSLGDEQMTIIPEKLYNPSQKKYYLSEISNAPQKIQATHNSLKFLNSTLIYHLDTSLERIIKSHQQVAQIFYKGSAFLKGCSKLMEIDSPKTVFTFFEKNSFQCAAFEGNELLLYNNYPFESAKDSLYYLLLVYEQLNLDVNEISLFLSGQIVRNSEIYNLFYRYIKNVNFIAPIPDLKLGDAFNNTHAHFYFDIFSLSSLEAS